MGLDSTPVRIHPEAPPFYYVSWGALYMTVTSIHVLDGEITLTDLDSGYLQIEVTPRQDKQKVKLGSIELRSLLTYLRHHAQKRRH